jgi:hypothetical protein
MNFTREPILETVVTSKEGGKLLVRSSKALNKEEYVVDAVEIISFAGSLFYYSSERPKTFILPINDYEIVEVKETRMALKTQSLEKSIKIGSEEERMPQDMSRRNNNNKRNRKKNKERFEHSHQGQKQDVVQSQTEELPPTLESNEAPKEMSSEEIKPVESQEAPPQVVKKLIPPPTGLIKEKLAKYKIEEEKAQEKLQEEKKGESSPFLEEKPPEQN